LSVNYNGMTYYYVTNIQGDVIALLNSAGNTAVSYTYDAWGNVLSVTGYEVEGIGTLNPLRYRGYVYDVETHLYYLQSRYYNSELGRFLNADAYVSTEQGFEGYNTFAYCGNNPVNRIDPTGRSFVGIAIVIGLVFLLRADDPQTITNAEIRAQEEYKQELDKAKKVYNETTVSINGNLPSEQAKIKVSILPDYTKNGKSDPVIHIENSYKIRTKAEREAILDVIIASPEFDSTIFTRGKDFWMAEWTGHNFFYDYLFWTFLGDNLADVDLNERERIRWDICW